MLAVSFFLLSAPLANAETRTLKLYFVHTREKAEITFKRNGRYDQSGLNKVNRFLRDWRRNEPTKMDPRLLDIVWEAYKQSGSNDYIHVISAYRSPATNGMLRSRSKGVAKKSQHMLGKAMDFYIPGVKLKTLRNIGLKLQAGGVGYYPRSGSPFVHLDVGSVRHWPRMSRSELVAVFPSGKTLHVPSDGKPLPGYDQAVASYESRKKSGGLAIASARAYSDDEGSGGSGRNGKGFLAAFFGGGADEEEDNNDATAVAAAAPEPAPKSNDSKIRVVAPQDAQRVEIASAPAEEEPEAIIAALPARNIPVPGAAPRPLVDVGASPAAPLVEMAAAEPASLPFEMKPVEESAAVETEVALGIPLPTRRPDYTAATEGAQVALAAVEEETVGGVPMPAVRPDSAEEALRKIASAPLPDEIASDNVVVASLPKPAETGPFAETAEEIIPGEKVAALGYAADSPRSTLASRGDAVTVRTTVKSARATRNDRRPEPRAIVVAAQPDEARWALNSEPVANMQRMAGAPTFSTRAVTTAPAEVLTVGFQQGEMADANRFTGKAVTFLSVAKFQTN